MTTTSDSSKPDNEHDFLFDDDFIKELDKRWGNHLAGNSRLYTLDEVMEQIKQHRAKRQDAL